MTAKLAHRERLRRLCAAIVALPVLFNPSVSLACGDPIEVELAEILEDTMNRFPLEQGSKSAVQNYHYVVVSAVRKRDRRYKEAACRLLVASLRAAGQLEAKAELYGSCLAADIEEGSKPDMQMADLADLFYLTPYLPIVRVSPVYPAVALNKGLEGTVDLAFTVTPDGRTTSIRVTGSTDGVFERAAVGAAGKFKYKPCVRDEQPVAVEDVIARVTFSLERDERRQPGGSQKRRLW